MPRQPKDQQQPKQPKRKKSTYGGGSIYYRKSVEPGGRFFWHCDACHPELLAWLDQREASITTREVFQEERICNPLKTTR